MRNLYRYLIEATLIFISVFAAFLLEARRNKDFERQSLVEELRAFKTDLASDSVFLGDFMFHKDIWSVYKDVYQPDSLILRMILQNSSELVDSIFNVWRYSSSLRTNEEWFNLKYLAEWSNEQSGLNHVLQYGRYFSTFKFKRELTSYMHSRSRINSAFDNLNNRNEEVNLAFQSDYILSKSTNKKLINDPLFQNSIRYEYKMCINIFEEVYDMLEDYEEMIDNINQEIAFQQSKQLWSW